MQDFCVRLGLLKAITCLLPSNRRSIPRELLLHRMEENLFGSAWLEKDLVHKVSIVIGEPLDQDLDPEHEWATADALLLAGNCSSWSQFIQNRTSYKVLEWALSIGLVAPGYRITEWGLMMRHILGDAAVHAIETGDYSRTNPFILSERERAFFLYHLSETDELLLRIILAVGRLSPGTIIDTQMAHRITIDCFESFLETAEPHVALRDLPKLRTARDLATRIREELTEHPLELRRRPVHSAERQRKTASRKTTKNADHQMVPRFEQLVDLGFLSKPIEPGLRGRYLYRRKVGWLFAVENKAALFAKAFGNDSLLAKEDWQLSNFFGPYAASSTRAVRCSEAQALEEFERTFFETRRIAGMTPFESVAVVTAINALGRGLVVEIEALHSILLAMKHSGQFSHYIAFAAGNQVHRMFISIRPGLALAFKEATKGSIE